MLFSADSADHQRGMQQAALFRRERQVVWGFVLCLLFGGFVCDYRDLRENRLFYTYDRIIRLLFSADVNARAESTAS